MKCGIMILILMSAISASVANAIVGADSSNSGTVGENDTNTSITLVDVSGTDRLLVVGVSILANNEDETVSSISYTPSGGSAESLTLEGLFFDLDVGSNTGDSKLRAEIWYRIAPTAGTGGTVTVTFSNPVAKGAVIGVTSFTGVDQTTPFGTFVSEFGDSTSPGVDVAGVSFGGMAYNVLAAEKDADPSASGSQVSQWNTLGFETGGAGGTELNTTASTVTKTMSWSQEEKKWPLGGVPINPGSPTAAIIGKVQLRRVPVNQLMPSLVVDQVGLQELQGIVRFWVSDQLSAASSKSRAAYLDAMINYLDPDKDGWVVALSWETLEERGTIGFYVEHSLSVNKRQWRQIHQKMFSGLIMAPQGEEYLLAGPSADTGVEYFYRLIEQEAWGAKRSYGPFTLKAEQFSKLMFRRGNRRC